MEDKYLLEVTLPPISWVIFDIQLNKNVCDHFLVLKTLITVQNILSVPLCQCVLPPLNTELHV